MKYFLGLDIGGTKTACVLADQHKELGRAQAGSAKVLRVDKAEAELHLKEVLDAVSHQSGIALSDVTASCIGTSGAAISNVVEWLKQQMAMRVGGSLTLLGDEIITLDAAFPQDAGVVVIAGTGSNVVGRTHNGRLIGAGGWGPALADEGSGNLLGQQALRATFAAINAGEEPPLLQGVLNKLGLHTKDDLVAVANAYGFSFAQIMPVVAEAARDGDSLAQKTLERGGVELAGLVRHVITRLIADEPGIADGLKIAGTGSVWQHVPEVSDAMRRTLLQTYPRLNFLSRTVDPLEGALWHARHAGD
ncbi:BadF/BadG/BcrA/BcrD ATPase family protein [Tunturiibacter lichenicola]|uniref:BadF/BadG/BcrA/BcrD ATPase family protein n=1 Tax=Tunturiibacter lichenicola TaxID=2051959 RepID=UPI0021B4696A|nr:BadF/BadG/BcrA/BcrD ATPase family protein [Edaphobacter lichenicola]